MTSAPLMSTENGQKKIMEICKDQSEDFIRDSKSFYENRIFPDVLFEVEGEEIPAHKAVLASRSNYFMKMFTSISIELFFSEGSIK